MQSGAKLHQTIICLSLLSMMKIDAIHRHANTVSDANTVHRHANTVSDANTIHRHANTVSDANTVSNYDM